MIEQSGEAYETDKDLSNTARLGFNEIIPGPSSTPEEHSVQQEQDLGQAQLSGILPSNK